MARGWQQSVFTDAQVILPWVVLELEGTKGSYGAENLYREGVCQPDCGKCPVPPASR